jgi:toxin ParE1/3/4
MLIRWTDVAAADFTHVCDYTEDRFGAAQARRAAMVIYESIDSLKTLPHKGRLGRSRGTRELNIPKLPFIVVYRLHKDSIEINRILHSAQKWP